MGNAGCNVAIKPPYVFNLDFILCDYALYLFIYLLLYFFMTTRIQSIDESRLWDIGAFTCLLEECPPLPFTKVILQVISNQNIT